ncbi:MAG TPA: hypothetical protein VFH58_02015 [Acidimicrobiales bacterium]|nr:hypothetical protein [Acidimicrobiales bacterium]
MDLRRVRIDDPVVGPLLETGPLQPEAAALYDGRGYKRIPKYGPYPEALAFETELSPAGASREPPNL